MANKTLTGVSQWDDPKTVVNGDPDDQALDEDCHQRHANRAEWLRTRINAHAALATGAHAASAISVVPIGEIITTTNVQAALGQVHASLVEVGTLVEQVERDRAKLVGGTYYGVTTALQFGGVAINVRAGVGGATMPLVVEVPKAEPGDKVLVHVQTYGHHEVVGGGDDGVIVSITTRAPVTVVCRATIPRHYRGSIVLSGIDTIRAGTSGTVYYDVKASGEGELEFDGTVTAYAVRFRG